MKRSYYDKSISDFILDDNEKILGILANHHGYQSIDVNQRNSWSKQISTLKKQLAGLNGHIYFEFSIPRMGKRVDNIIILGSTIF